MEILREVEVADGINVSIDRRWVVMFPHESKAQVDLLIEAVNHVFCEKCKQ